jgi:hypothetical protein
MLTASYLAFASLSRASGIVECYIASLKSSPSAESSDRSQGFVVRGSHGGVRAARLKHTRILGIPAGYEKRGAPTARLGRKSNHRTAICGMGRTGPSQQKLGK